MNRTDNPTTTLSLDTQADETRMRRALGLHTGGGPAPVHQQRPEQARQRHRFAQDGSVPVVMLSRSDAESGGAKDRIAKLEADLEAERAHHGGTKRALHDSQAALQAAQTRLAHTELAHAEALRTERQARKTAEEALAAHLAAPAPARTPRKMIEVANPAPVDVAPVEIAPAEIAPEVEAPEQPPAALAQRKPRKLRIRAEAPAKEPKPVRWWTASYRAKQG